MEVRRSMGVFYADSGLVGSWDLKWLQGALNVRIRLFCRIDLLSNVSKSKTIICQPGEICIGMSEEAFSRKGTG